MEADELGMESEEGNVDSGHSVRRNIPLMLKGSRAGRKKPSSPRRRIKEPQPPPEPVEADLPVLRGPAEPTHKKQTLRWDHRVNLIGEKVTDPRIHCCELCDLPILIYGRMIPCKHVFCFDCARKCNKTCGRCKEPVSRIEQSGVGTVYVCTFEGPRHSWKGCRRTYLSHRDLQAHVEHRHLKTGKKRAAAGVNPAQQSALQQPPVANLAQAVVQQIHASVAHPMPNLSIPPPDFSAGAAYPSGPAVSSQYPPPAAAPTISYSAAPPAAATTVTSNPAFPMAVPRSHNLISIPILDDGSNQHQQQQQQQQLGPTNYPPQLPPQQQQPPPQQQQFFNPQPANHAPAGPDLSRPPPIFSGPPPPQARGVNMSHPPPAFRPPGPFNSPPDGSPRHNWSGPPPQGRGGNMRGGPGRGPSGGHRNFYQ